MQFHRFDRTLPQKSASKCQHFFLSINNNFQANPAVIALCESINLAPEKKEVTPSYHHSLKIFDRNCKKAKNKHPQPF